jgi:hypothetical protein
MPLLRNAVLLLVSAALLLPGTAHANSYFLDQTNTTSVSDPNGNLPDGTNYLQVTFTDSIAVVGDIDVTVHIRAPLTGIADVNFGLQSFHFNSTNTLSAGDIIGLPLNWSASMDFDPNAPHQNADGFGRFEVKLAGTGMSRVTPTLSFSIRIGGDSVNDYAEASVNSVEGPTFFAAEVRGFKDQNLLPPADDPNDGVGLCFDSTGQGDFTADCNFLTSAWFGGVTVVPEPSSGLLLLAGLTGLAAMRRRKAAH